MKQTRWFDRKFEFKSDQKIFPSILERLEGTPLRLEYKIQQIKIDHLTIKLNGNWSIQENVGHLIDLEPLWQGRLDDIIGGQKYLRPTDLENKATDLANHHAKDIRELLSQFQEVRSRTMARLQLLSEEDLLKSALHPRLETPMRISDLFLFVAEHDDHHLATMTALNNHFRK